jgi:photosystem II stability/assembly factor-like uncharacterized protein
MKSYHFLIPFILGIILLLSWSSLAQTGWMTLNSGTNYNLRAVFPLNYEIVFVTGDGARVLTSTDGGNNWLDISPVFSSVNLNDIVFFDSLSGLVVGDAGTIYRTTDGGANWSPVTSGIGDNLLSVSFADSNGICGALSQSILYSTDLGESWMVAQSGFFGGGLWGAYMLSPNLGYLLGDNSIFQPLLGMTTDGGANWNFVPFYLNNNEGRGYDVIFTDIQRGYAACRVWDGRGAVASTSDGGSTWNSTFFANPLYGIDFPISNASLVGYALGDDGTIIKTTNAGNTWQSQNSGTLHTLNDMSFLDLDYGFAVGDGGTILKTETGGEPSVRLLEPDNMAPTEVKLLGNYPNPFNPVTTISWQLPVSSPVNLEIFNLRGQRVASLIRQRLPTGPHSIEFDATGLASGVYFYQLEVGAFKEVKKMILVR